MNKTIIAAAVLSTLTLQAHAEEGLYERRLEAARVTICATNTLAPVVLVEGGVELPGGIPAWPLMEAPPIEWQGCREILATHSGGEGGEGGEDDDEDGEGENYAEGDLALGWKEDGTVGFLVYSFLVRDGENGGEYVQGDYVDTITHSDEGRRYLVESLLSYDGEGMERRYEIGFTRNSPDSSDDPSTLMRITQETDRATVIVDLDYRTQEEN